MLRFASQKNLRLDRATLAKANERSRRLRALIQSGFPGAELAPLLRGREAGE